MEGVFAATIEVLLQNLVSNSIEVVKLVSGYTKDLMKLKNNLLLVQDLLAHADELSNNRRVVKRWLEQLEDVAMGADDVLDEINYQLLRVRVLKQNGENKKVCSFIKSSFLTSLRFRRRMVQKIKDVNIKLELITQEAISFGLQVGKTTPQQQQQQGRDIMKCVKYLGQPIDTSFNDDRIVGRESELSYVVGTLVAPPDDQVFSIVSIVGIGGIGKTTLAQQVYNHEKIHTYFDRKIWVRISVRLDVLVFKMILESLTSEKVQVVMKRTDLLEKIQEHLAGKRYLLVLDDVWDDKLDRWEDFLNSLSAATSVNGNGILVTTRKQTVALPFVRYTMQLNRLSDDHCWSIIKSRALSGFSHPVEFEGIGKRLAQKCGGVPLAAKIIGGVLYGKSKDNWFSILKNELSYFVQDDNIALKILKLSYEHLPSSFLKKCFAYFSVFPQEYLIERDELVQLWMAEGFLQGDETSDMEFVGNIYIDILLQNCLLQEETKGQYGQTSFFWMPNLVHDMVSLVVQSGNTHHRRYLHLDSLMDEGNVNLQEESEYLSTIFLRGNVVPDMLGGFKSLRVIKLTAVNVEELPTAIGKLQRLRLIDISGTQIKYLPDSIGKLHHLQTLRTLQLKKLPNSIVDLISLRHLHISSIQVPPRIGKLTSLRTLRYYKVGHEKGFKIGELEQLKNLSGELTIENLQLVNDKEEAKHADLFGKPRILRLYLKWKEPREGETNDQNVLEGLQPHPNLKSLVICGFKGKNFPLWTMKMAVQNFIPGSWVGLDNLTNLSLRNCDQCDQVPVLGHLPHLRKLQLNGLPNVQSIGLSIYGIENCSAPGTSNTVCFQETAIAFPALEELVLVNMQNLREWVDVEGANVVFPCLKYLRIWCCPKLKIVPSQLSSKKLIINQDTL